MHPICVLAKQHGKRGGGRKSFISWRIFSQDNKKKYIRYFSNLTQPGLSEVEPLWDLSTRGA